MRDSAFKVRKINEENLGDYLKNGRESLGLTIETVAKSLTISKEYIIALEQNDFFSLPPNIYSRGIVGSYANFVQIDPKKAILLYEKRKKRVEKDSFSFHPISPYSKIFRYVNYRNFILLMGTMISMTLIYFLIKIILPLYSQPSFALSSPATCPFNTNEETIELRGTIQPEGHIFINGEDILVDKNGVFSSPVFLKPGENQIRFKIVNKFKKEREEGCVIRRN